MKVMKLLLVLSLLFVLSACGSSSHKKSSLPDGARVEVDWGNGWTVFVKDGHRFLFYKSSNWDKTYCAITELDATF